MNDMTSTAKWFGRLLILVGLAGYAYGAYNGNASWTALIPAIVGLVLMVLGYAAAASEGMRKHLMHAAVVVALLGLIAAAGRLIPRLGEFTVSAATLSQIAMGVICLVFVVLAVRSFIAARSTESPKAD
jgi:hypothetical protein